MASLPVSTLRVLFMLMLVWLGVWFLQWQSSDLSSIPSDDVAKNKTQHSFQAAQGRRRRYLLYYSHSGFSNQLIGLDRALWLAEWSNRTLVLPPVLPHCPVAGVKFPDYACRPGLPWNSQKAIKRAQLDAWKAYQSLQFPSWTQLIQLPNNTNSIISSC